MWVFPLTKFVLLQLRQHKFWSIHIQILNNFKKIIFKQFCTFHPSPICTFHRSQKTCTWLDEQFRTFHPSLHESVTSGYGPVKSFWSSIKEDFSGIPETTDDENLKKLLYQVYLRLTLVWNHEKLRLATDLAHRIARIILKTIYDFPK